MGLRDGIVVFSGTGARSKAALIELLDKIRNLDMDEVRVSQNNA